MVREFDSVLALFLLLWASIASAQSKQLEGNWTLTVGEDPSSYEVIASLHQESANAIKDEYATIDVNPRLAFRCVPGKAEITARIDWQRFISSFNTEVGFKVDGGKFVWVKWGVDQSNKITMSKTASDSQALIDHLASGSELLVEISPYSESPVTVQYDLGGLSEGLDALRAECQKTSD
jgi:type VI secretion system protein VasI